MKTYTVYAERVVLEALEIEAMNEDEALAKAMEADNDEWSTQEDLSWEIVSASSVEDDETYDEFGVNTKNSFNTPPKD